MKANEIKVGDHYIARVGVNITVVKVDSIDTRAGSKWLRGGTAYSVTNVKTGRETTFRSASKFRRAATIEEIRKAKGIAAPANPAWKVDQPRGIDTYRAAQEKAKLGSDVPAPTGNIHTPNGYAAAMAATNNVPAAQPVEGEPVFVVMLMSLGKGTEYVGRDGDGRFGLFLLGCSAYRFRGHSGWKSAMSFANQYARPDRSAFVVCESYTTGPC